MGRVASITNPHWGSSSTTDGTTTFSYDGLGRMIQQVEADSTSTQHWSYAGPTVTYTDENNNQWLRTYDVMGRLIQVIEPGSLDTTYQYDVLSNLLCVDQWGTSTPGTACTSSRARNFSYDMLSRLLTADNRETGTVVYSYDANGNVVTRTDARNVVTNYSYDSLNRLLSKTYTNAPSGTLSNCYQYDNAANGLGRLSTEWTQAGSCASTPPSNFQTSRVIGAYDAMGRVVSEQQCVAGYCTSPSVPSQPTPNCPVLTSAAGLQFCYDLAGNLLAYGSGITTAAAGNFPQVAMNFSQTFDAAGRLSTVSSSFSDNTHPATLFTAQGYTPASALSNWELGPNLYTARNYDVRQRVCSQLSAVGQSTTAAQCGQ
jgi:YD repeat-containing protein